MRRYLAGLLVLSAAVLALAVFDASPPVDKAVAHNSSDSPAVLPPPGNVTAKPHRKPTADNTDIDPGAYLRGFYVFCGLSGMALIYIGFKVYRLRSGEPPQLAVRKYGVLTKRNDVEMLPLPLNEEEDDDTIFEAPSAGQQTQQH